MKQNITILKALTILFIEDDEVMLENTSSILEIFFKDVYTATNIDDAKELYESNKPDFILSDIKLKDENGLEFVKFVRKSDYTTPIVIISSYSNQEYLMEAANIGIDGYLIKPLQLNNITDTLLKATKRIPYIDAQITLSPNLKYDYFKKELTYDEKRVELGEKEHQLFEFFINNANKTLSKQEIVYHIWPLEEVTDSAFKNLISRLRAKIGQDVIHTVKGKGWILYIDV
jgi:DNA-binding response OmpR family regulator